MLRRKETKHLIIHCSDTPESMDIGADEIRRWHVEDNGWSDIGYHYVIRRDGDVEMGRNEKLAGAHVRGKNSTSIGICMVGRNVFTGPQWKSLLLLIKDLLREYPDAQVSGHKNWDKGKTCPNFDAKGWWKRHLEDNK